MPSGGPLEAAVPSGTRGVSRQRNSAFLLRAAAILVWLVQVKGSAVWRRRCTGSWPTSGGAHVAFPFAPWARLAWPLLSSRFVFRSLGARLALPLFMVSFPGGVALARRLFLGSFAVCLLPFLWRRGPGPLPLYRFLAASLFLAVLSSGRVAFARRPSCFLAGCTGSAGVVVFPWRRGLGSLLLFAVCLLLFLWLHGAGPLPLLSLLGPFACQWSASRLSLPRRYAKDPLGSPGEPPG